LIAIQSLPLSVEHPYEIIAGQKKKEGKEVTVPGN
jgi:hypothetical protein